MDDPEAKWTPEQWETVMVAGPGWCTDDAWNVIRDELVRLRDEAKDAHDAIYVLTAEITKARDAERMLREENAKLLKAVAGHNHWPGQKRCAWCDLEARNAYGRLVRQMEGSNDHAT